MGVAKAIGAPIFVEAGLDAATDFPHTITSAIMYRTRINSFQELPDDKRPPRNLWDKPYRLGQWFDDVFKTGSNKSSAEGKTYIEFNEEEVE